MHPHSQKSLPASAGLQFSLKLPPEPEDAPEDPPPVGGQNNTRRDPTRPLWTGRSVSAWHLETGPGLIQCDHGHLNGLRAWWSGSEGSLPKHYINSLHTLCWEYGKKNTILQCSPRARLGHTCLSGVKSSPLGWHHQGYLIPLICE